MTEICTQLKYAGGCAIAGVDPIDAITKEIKDRCKETKSVKHQYWALLRKDSEKISHLTRELGAGMAYGLTWNEPYSTVVDAGRSLAAACKGKSSLDLISVDASYRRIVEHHQCMELQGKIADSVSDRPGSIFCENRITPSLLFAS